MGDDIEHLKTVFRSLVVSSPTQVNVWSLLRDYRNMIGAPVPLTKYGYRDPVEFLKERFSDCFLFSGAPSNPVLTLIVPNTLKHIDKFVQKQKSSGSTKFNPKRRSVPEEAVTPLKEKFQNFVARSNLKLTEEPNQSTASNGTVSIPHEAPSKHSTVPNKVYCNGDIVRPHKNVEDKIIISKPKDISSIVNNKSNDNIPQSVPYKETNKIAESKTEAATDNRNALKNFLKKRLPQYDSSQYLDDKVKSSESLDKPDKSIYDNESDRHTCSSGNSSKVQQLEQLKHAIMQLISDAPEGVWCTDLIRLYRERYNRDLNFTRFGYTSILSLVYSLERRVQVTRPVDTGDWLLTAGDHAVVLPHPHRARAARLTLSSERVSDPEDALPGIDFDPDVFPEDCMHFMESIEPVSLEDFQPGAMVEVLIGEVYSPSHFWFIRAGENYSVAMEDMMDEMTCYYRAEGRERVLARGAARVGHYCSALFDGDWHRSLIVRVVDSDTVKVRHVDYGTVQTVAVGALKPLRREWARLPAQAARAPPPPPSWRW